MKKFLILAGFVFGATLPMEAKAATEVIETITSTTTTRVVTLSTSAIQVDPSSISLARRTFIAIQNLHATAAVECSENAGLLIAEGGFAVPSNKGTVPIKARAGGPLGVITFYCKTDIPGSKVAVIQGY